MIKNFNNITPDDIRNVSGDELKNMTVEQSEKYGIALKKYAMLNRLSGDKLKFNDLINSLNKIEGTNEDTVVEIKLKDEYNEEDKGNFMSSEYGFVAYFDAVKNKVVIQNFV